MSSLPSVFIFKLYFPTASPVHPHSAWCLPLLGQAKSRPTPFPRAAREHYDIWLVGFARKTDTRRRHHTKGRRKNRSAGSRERKGWYKMTQQQNRFPEIRGRHGRLLGPRSVRVKSRGSPSSRSPGRAGCRVTAALPGAGGKGPSREDPPAPCRPGVGTPSLQVPALRSYPPVPAPGEGGPAPSARATTRSGGRAPSRPPVQKPPPRELTLTKAGGAAASSSRCAPWAPSSRGGGGASETQTRVCSKSRAQRHSTDASHNTLGPPRPRAPLCPPLHSVRPASPGGFLCPAFSAALGPPLGNPSTRHSARRCKYARAPRDSEWELCQSFRAECSIG